jgi:hypothetical protein
MIKTIVCFRFDREKIRECIFVLLKKTLLGRTDQMFKGDRQKVFQVGV